MALFHLAEGLGRYLILHEVLPSASTYLHQGPLLPTEGSTALAKLSATTHQAVSGTSKGKKNMPLLQVVIALIVVGILLWLVNRFIPMAGSIKSILNAVVVIATVLWLLNIFGLMQSLTSIHIGKP